MPEETPKTETGIILTTGNEIGPKGKLWAGILLILFTFLSVTTLIAYWPDRLPTSSGSTVYKHRLFDICLLDSAVPCENCGPQKVNTPIRDSLQTDSIFRRLLDSAIARLPGTLDSIQAVAKRRADSIYLKDSLQRQLNKATATVASVGIRTIRLNTLLLILVATAGFMGTMIHIASSFTNYVGSEKFKKSWMLWYFVKPFTGAALAVIFYFVFRAGLLNFNDPNNINLYGLITLAAFAGLFTDKASLKLEEIFSVVFRPKDERPDKIKKDEINVSFKGIKPEGLFANEENQLVISGEGFDKKKFVIKIDEDEIKNPVIKNDSISFTYKIPEGQDKNEFMLRIFDEEGKEVHKVALKKNESIVKPEPLPGTEENKPTNDADNDFGAPDTNDPSNPIIKE